MGRSKKNPEIFVKVARTGSATKEVALDGGRTVKDALEAAGVRKKESETIRVNGEEVDMTFELEDGDRLILVKNIEGGQ